MVSLVTTENLVTKAFCPALPGQVWAGFFSGKSAEKVRPVRSLPVHLRPLWVK